MATYTAKDSLSNVQDKVVIVTGASSGIGAATTVLLSSMGANVVAVANEPMEATESQCAPDQILTIQTDLRQVHNCRYVINTAISKFNKIDGLVNVAGIAKLADLATTTPEDFEEIFDINVKAMFFLTQFAVPHLEHTRGAVVNVSSTASLIPSVKMFAYSMSKAAVDQMTRCAAEQLSVKQIRVNSVNPTTIGDTPILVRHGMTLAERDIWNQRVANSLPLARVGHSSEVASAIVYLLSDCAAFITGVCLPIDGGQYNRWVLNTTD